MSLPSLTILDSNAAGHPTRGEGNYFDADAADSVGFENDFDALLETGTAVGSAAGRSYEYRRVTGRRSMVAPFRIPLTLGAATAVATTCLLLLRHPRYSRLQLSSIQGILSRVEWSPVAGAAAGSTDRWYTTAAAQSSTTPDPFAAPATPVAPANDVDLRWFNQASEALKPSEAKGDGNRCGDDEEECGGLCYKRCKELTWGQYPIRTSAFTCCKQHPCTLLNMQGELNICGGFDVAGDSEGKKACPHTAGACLKDEELHLGMCYKKCSIMEPRFPFRFAAETCCNTHGLMCFAPGNAVTSSQYAIGGGGGDGDPDTPKDVHWPISDLTES